MRIAVSIIGQTLDEQKRDIDKAEKQGADILELRFDYLGKQEQKPRNIRTLLNHSALPMIYTNREISQAGRDPRAGFKGSEEEREELCRAAAELNPKFIDTEFGYDLDWAGDSIHILSYHDFYGTPSGKRLMGIAKSMANSVRYTCPGIIKIATKAINYIDSQTMLEFTDDMIKYRGGPRSIQFIGICMGQCGIPTRVLGPTYGSYLTFASLEGKASAPGQLTIKELKEAARLLQIKD